MSRYPQYEFIALSANNNIDILEKQALKYRPAKVAVVNQQKADVLRQRLPDEISVMSGKESLAELAALPEIDIVLVSVVGISGLGSNFGSTESRKSRNFG